MRLISAIFTLMLSSSSSFAHETAQCVFTQPTEQAKHVAIILDNASIDREGNQLRAGQQDVQFGNLEVMFEIVKTSFLRNDNVSYSIHASIVSKSDASSVDVISYKKDKISAITSGINLTISCL